MGYTKPSLKPGKGRVKRLTRRTNGPVTITEYDSFNHIPEHSGNLECEACRKTRPICWYLCPKGNRMRTHGGKMMYCAICRGGDVQEEIMKHVAKIGLYIATDKSGDKVRVRMPWEDYAHIWVNLADKEAEKAKEKAEKAGKKIEKARKKAQKEKEKATSNTIPHDGVANENLTWKEAVDAKKEHNKKDGGNEDKPQSDTNNANQTQVVSTLQPNAAEVNDIAQNNTVMQAWMEWDDFLESWC